LTQSDEENSARWRACVGSSVGRLENTPEKFATTLVGKIKQLGSQFFVANLLCKFLQLLAHVPNKGEQCLVIIVPSGSGVAHLRMVARSAKTSQPLFLRASRFYWHRADVS